MKKRNQLLRYRNKLNGLIALGAISCEGEGGSGGEGGDGAPTKADFADMQTKLSTALDSIGSLEANNKKLLQEKGDIKKASEKAVEDAARGAGDVEALEKSWSDKLDALGVTHATELGQYKQMVNGLTVGAAATKLASDISLPGHSEGILPHISNRLTVEVKDGAASVRVLDVNGNPSAASVEDLKTELLNSKVLAPMLIGSKANGGGKPGNGADGSKTVTRDSFDKMSQVDRSKFAIDGGKVVDG